MKPVNGGNLQNWIESGIKYEDELINHFQCEEFYYQIEDSNGSNPHLQLCIKLKTRLLKSTLINKLHDNLITRGTHVMVPNNWDACKRYCSKNDTRVLGPFNHGVLFFFRALFNVSTSTFI